MTTMDDHPRRVLLLVDGNALVHRAFHALPPLTTSKTGEMVNAVYGFANTLFKVVSSVKPSHWAIAFDYPAPTFRHKLYEKYKAQRPPTPEELKGQIRRVHDLAAALGMPIFEIKGFEADDVLGTLATRAHAAGIAAAILTGDRDLLQVISPGITVLLPGRNFSDAITYDAEAVVARFGVEPSQLTSYKALVGDASDNIPGVPGIGEKTAAKLLNTFGDLDSIFEHLPDVMPQRVQTSLAESKELAETGRRLSTIVTDVPLEFSLDDCRIGNYDLERALELLKELEFNSLASRLPQVLSETDSPSAATTTPPVATPTPSTDAVVYSEELATALDSELARAHEVVLCPVLPAQVQTGSRSGRRGTAAVATLDGLGISDHAGRLVYIPTISPSPNVPEGLISDGTRDVLRSAFTNGHQVRVSDDAKSVIRFLMLLGIPEGDSWFDIPVAAHLAGDKAVTLAALALNRLGLTLGEPRTSNGPLAGRSDEETAAILSRYAAACWALREQLTAEMAGRQVLDLFTGVEMPLVPVLAEMENNGILVDAQKLREMSRTLGEQLAALEIDIYNAVGHRFNIGSPKQLGNVLYNELGLPGGRKGSSGPSTEASQTRIAQSCSSGHRPGAAVPPVVKAEVYVRGHPSRVGKYGHGQNPHRLQPDHRGYRPALVERP